MKLFLTKYLRVAHALYFAIGITVMPLFAQWFSPSLDKEPFLLCFALTAVYAAVASLIIYLVVKNLFWKLVLTMSSGILAVAILFPVFQLSPLILAILGIIALSGGMQLFDSLKETFPEIDNSQIQRWLEVVLMLFAIFVSSMMVGFTISWNNLYGEVLKGTIERRVVFIGINYTLIITMYYWLGAGLIFLSGVKHLWLSGGHRSAGIGP